MGIVVRFQGAREALNEGAQLGIPEVTTDAGKKPPQPADLNENIPEHVKEHIRAPKKWPVVRFGTREVLCVPAQFEVNTADGINVQARRNQIPLILAWALSIHKAQGQTLERVRVNMTRVFEKGQGASTTDLSQ